MAHETGTNSETSQLLEKLDVIGDDSRFSLKLLFLCMVPSILNGLHVMSYIYLAVEPEHWCKIGGLNSSWTNEEIKAISSPNGAHKSSCWKYDWDYSIFQNMTYEEALKYVETNKKPGISECSNFSFERNISSITLDYELVCDRLPLKSMIQMMLSLGKFMGAFVFGILSDRFGRKISFMSGVSLYILSGPLVGLALNYEMVLIGRLGIGMATSAVYHSLLIVISEICSSRKRGMMTMLYTLSYPIGEILCGGTAYFIRNWRIVQLTISSPALLIAVFFWFTPESPRWQISKGKKDKAKKFIDKELAKILRRKGVTEFKRDEGEPSEVKAEPDQPDNRTLKEKFRGTLSEIGLLLRYPELRHRLLIILMSYFALNLTYYALALNVTNYLADLFIFGVVTALVEFVSYLIPIPFLRYMGRKATCVILFYTGGVSLLTLLFLPRDEGELNLEMIFMSNIGRMFLAGVYVVVLMQTTELFPTCLRNTVLGFAAMSSHVGAMSSPFIVDLLGSFAWYIPSTLCGCLALFVGTVTFLVPETKNKPLPETVEDVINLPKEDKFGCHHLCK